MAQGWTGKRRGHRAETDAVREADRKARMREVKHRALAMGEEERAYWHWLLTRGEGGKDRSRPGYGATVKQFKESFMIRGEDGTYVRFRERPKQAYRRMRREAAWAKGHVFRSLTLKTRRYGISKDEILSSVECLVRVAGWVGATVAKNQQDFRLFKGYAREFFNQIPPQAFELMGLEVVSDADDRLTVRHGTYKESMYLLYSANTSGLGRGGGLNKLHPTEGPYYTTRAQDEYDGARPSLGKFAGCEEPWEFTAKGFDAMCYAQWQMAHWPDTPREEWRSDFERIFIAAYEHPNAYRAFESEAAMEEFAESVGTLERYGGAEESFYESLIFEWQMKLGAMLRETECEASWPFPVVEGEAEARRRTLEQLHYFRFVQNDECSGSLEKRKSDFPMTAEEAFVSTGSPFFNPALVQGWHPVAHEWERTHAVRGNFVVSAGDVRWQPTPGGIWVMRADRETNTSYCFGQDTASGRERRADGKTEADFPVTFVGTVLTKFVVAYLRQHLRPRDVAYELAKASWYYGRAPGLIERSPTGDEGSTISVMETTRLPGIDWDPSEVLLHTLKPVQSDWGTSMERQVGFDPRRGNKRPMLDRARDHFEVEVGGVNKEAPCPLPAPLLAEMVYFEKDEQGKVEASQGHDDTIMAWGMFLMAADLVQENPEELMSPVRAEKLDWVTEREWVVEQQRRRGPGPLKFYGPQGAGVVTAVRDRDLGIPGMEGF